MRICVIVHGAGDARGSGRGRTAPAASLRKRLANSRSNFGLLSVSPNFDFPRSLLILCAPYVPIPDGITRSPKKIFQNGFATRADFRCNHYAVVFGLCRVKAHGIFMVQLWSNNSY